MYVTDVTYEKIEKMTHIEVMQTFFYTGPLTQLMEKPYEQLFSCMDGPLFAFMVRSNTIHHFIRVVGAFLDLDAPIQNFLVVRVYAAVRKFDKSSGRFYSDKMMDVPTKADLYHLDFCDKEEPKKQKIQTEFK